MDWRTHSYLTMCVMFYILTGSLTATEDVKENSTITLPCHQTIPKFIRRTWFKGFLNASTNLSAIAIFSEIGGLEVTPLGPGGPEKTVVLPTFSLSISRVGLGDDDYFSCKAVLRGGGVQYTNTRLRVYVQPTITMTTTSTILTEGDFITVYCNVPRVYPVHHLPQGLVLHWRNGSTAGDPDLNADRSHSYSVSRSWRVGLEEDGTNVSCSIVPRMGEKVVEYRIISVTAKEDTPVLPRVNQSNVQYEAIIGGCVILLLLVVLGAAIYLHKVRTRTRDNRDDGDVPIIQAEPIHQGNENNPEPADPVNQEVQHGDGDDLAHVNRPAPMNLDEDIPKPADQIPKEPVDNADTVNGPAPANPESDLEFEEWLKATELSEATRKKLEDEELTTIPDLERLDENNVMRLRLSIGQENRLKDGLKGLKRKTIGDDDLLHIKISECKGTDNKAFEPDEPATHEEFPASTEHPSLNNQEGLPHEAKENGSEFETWLVANGISDSTLKKFQDEEITEITDLENLDESDIDRLRLSIGEKIRLKAGLKYRMDVGEWSVPVDTPADPTFEEWLETYNISEATKTRLHSEEILTIADLNILELRDIDDLSLKVGQRNRLKYGLRMLKRPLVAESII